MKTKGEKAPTTQTRSVYLYMKSGGGGEQIMFREEEKEGIRFPYMSGFLALYSKIL